MVDFLRHGGLSVERLARRAIEATGALEDERLDRTIDRNEVGATIGGSVRCVNAMTPDVLFAWQSQDWRMRRGEGWGDGKCASAA
jgi:hypothetical protein